MVGATIVFIKVSDRGTNVHKETGYEKEEEEEEEEEKKEEKAIAAVMIILCADSGHELEMKEDE